MKTKVLVLLGKGNTQTTLKAAAGLLTIAVMAFGLPFDSALFDTPNFGG